MLSFTSKRLSAFSAISVSFSRMSSSLTAKAIVYSAYGNPQDSIKVHSYNLPSSPSADQVLLQTIACPLNPSDINQIQGVYPSRPPLTTELGTKDPSAVCGNEGLFKVLATGPDVPSELKVGDWCIPNNVNFGTWRSHALTSSSNLMKLPQTLSVPSAATITVNPSSAYQMLTLYADLQPGDWFIQNGGNSQVGRAAIQIGKKLGLNSISIVRSRDNLKELKEELTKLGATHVITEEENETREFGKTVKSWTQGKPIKLGLNCIGGSNLTNMARKLGKDAVLLTYGGMSMKPVSLPTSLFIFKNLTAKGFWVTENIKRIPGSREDTINELIKLYESGELAEISHYEIGISSDASEDEFLAVFKKGLDESKKGKQLVVFN